MNITQFALPPTDEEDGDEFARKIVHILRNYPIISPSMLQIAIGSSLPTSVWKPVLERLITEGVVERNFVVQESSKGRHQSYTFLRLKGTTVTVDA